MSVLKGRTIYTLGAALPLAAVLLLFPACPAGAATNLEEKAKYEKFLETKVEDVLQNLLGPGKAKVMIQADLDFSMKESVTQGAAKGADGSGFKWANINQAAETSQQELLPGFPVESRLNMNADSNFSRELQFPPSMIKRLTVSLVLSETVTDEEAQKLRLVVESVLELQAKRGDDIRILKARFAPIWYTPEMMSILTRYGIVAVIAIIGMGIVAFGFLKMAGAMNNMAGSSQSKISMDMAGGVGVGGPGGAVGEGLPELEGPGAKEGGEEGGGLLETAKAADDVVFTVPPAKLGILVNMLAKESPADVALVAIHLPPEQRNRFLASFPPEKS